jgi:hypothetical protein
VGVVAIAASLVDAPANIGAASDDKRHTSDTTPAPTQAQQETYLSVHDGSAPAIVAWRAAYVRTRARALSVFASCFSCCGIVSCV